MQTLRRGRDESRPYRDGDTTMQIRLVAVWFVTHSHRVTRHATIQRLGAVSNVTLRAANTATTKCRHDDVDATLAVDGYTAMLT
ncbi:MAG: hypothetical protein HDS93_02335 [Bacteroidales bacterium]|nr:hypothetical protein [Bacteroidales bacterium]